MIDHSSATQPMPPVYSARSGMRRSPLPKYAGPLLAVTDFVCRSEPGAPATPSAAAELMVPLDALLFVRRGALVAQLGAASAPSWRRAVLAAPGDVLLLRAGRGLALAHPSAPLSGMASPERGDHTTSLRLAGDLADEVRWHIGVQRGAERTPTNSDSAPLAFRETDLGRIALHLHALRAAMAKCSSRDVLEIESRALALIEAVRSANADQPEQRKQSASLAHRRLVAHARELIAASVSTAPDESLSVRAIAMSVGVSPFHLSRTFRSLTGVGLHRYRTRLRLHSALDRLSDERHSLAAIALDLGFSSQAHFTTVFHREFGVSPGAWRGRKYKPPPN